MARNRKDENPLRAAALLGIMGADVAVCILAGYGLGYLLHNKLGFSEGWIVGGVLGGLVVGIASVVLLLRKFLEEPDG